MVSYETIIQKLEKITKPYIARFIIYYYTPEDQRKPWDSFKTCHEILKHRTYDQCLEWLTREDAIKAVQVYHKSMKNYNLAKLYDAMLEKAMNGDVNAAKWVESFSNGDYFKDDDNEIDDFLSGVKIEGIK